MVSLNLQAEVKPNLVLLPMDVSGQETEYESEYGSALQEGLQQRYTVFYGAAVEKELEKEYSKLNCDAETCNQNVAIAFNGELIADSSVKRTSSGYLLKMVIRNVITGKVLETKIQGCRGCDEFVVINKLKQIGAGTQTTVNNAQFVVGPASTGPLTGGVEMITAKVSGDTSSQITILVLESQPSGAEVYLGGVKAGTTPYQNYQLQAGQSVEITLKHREYHDKTVKLALKGGVNEVPLISLAPAFGSLAITSDPNGAVVYIAGEKVGMTPYNIEQLASNSYLLSLRESLHSPLENQRIEVTDGNKTEKHYKLTPIFGRLNIEAGTAGAIVTLYEKSAKKEATSKVITKALPAELKLETGTYQLVISKNGYEAKQAVVTITNGGTETIIREQAVLRQLTGSLLVTTESLAKNSKVYVNGELKGEVPRSLTLPVGQYELEVKEGDRGAKQSVKVEDRQNKVVVLALKVVRMPFEPEMVDVPAGSFKMGCHDWFGCRSDEGPTHQVTLSAFQMSKYEITQGQWQMVMGNNPSEFKACGNTCPVEWVSWQDTQEFIQKLNQLTGGNYRLPTESEWEFACRSGGKNETYCGGDDLAQLGWFYGNSNMTSHPVGQKQANGLGLYDMTGNVREWVQDLKGLYSANQVTNPTGPVTGSYRVRRGGSWRDQGSSKYKSHSASYSRSADSHAVSYGSRGNFLGFRLAR